jgi:hypothetical protein
MLMSVGKLSSIGEMFTIRLAASEPPGERHANIFDSLVVSVHFCGTVQDIPCASHLTVCPPAIASVCAAVGFAFSTSPSLEEEERLPVCPELLLGFSLLVKLQSERAKPSIIRTGICFMGHHSRVELKKAMRFYVKTGGEVNGFKQRANETLANRS